MLLREKVERERGGGGGSEGEAEARGGGKAVGEEMLLASGTVSSSALSSESGAARRISKIAAKTNRTEREERMLGRHRGRRKQRMVPVLAQLEERDKAKGYEGWKASS